MILILQLFFLILPLSSYANFYQVQRGDSLWEIAKARKISLSCLRKINDLYNDNVYPGQKLIIPTKIIPYIVKSTDSFESIAKQFNTPLKYIITLNNISENQVIEGQTLKIPIISPNSSLTSIANQQAKKINAQPIVYRVRKGDTLSDVALKYQTSVPKLKKLNNKRSNSIYVGEKLIVGNRMIPLQIKNNISSNKIIHKVKNGETLGSIALKYKVSIQKVKEWNHKSSATIYKNESLTIYTDKKIIDNSSSKSSISNKSNHQEFRKIQYTVRRGENLSFIAAKFQVQPSQIKNWNGKKSDKLIIGERLTIKIKKNPKEGNPTPQKENTKLIRYVVKNGDTLDGIAIKYNVRRSQIQAWNKKNSTKIYKGEQLRIFIPTTSSLSQSTPKKSKKAEYITRNSTGIRSNRFKDIPLPIKASQVLKTTSSGRGVDIELKSKTKIIAPISASVQYAGYINALRHVVILEVPNNRTIVYAGLGSLNVKTGQKIDQGHILGITSKTTLDDSHKLYMEIRDRNKVANAFYTYKELDKKRKR